MKKLTLEQLSKNNEWSEAVIVFKQESFGVKRKQFTVEECSYKVSRSAKYFDHTMISNSLFGDCLDGKDLGVRLDRYIHHLPEEGPRWEVDYCYIVNLKAMKNFVTAKLLVDKDEFQKMKEYVEWYNNTIPSDLKVENLTVEHVELVAKSVVTISFSCDKLKQAENLISSVKANYTLHHYDISIMGIQ